MNIEATQKLTDRWFASDNNATIHPAVLKALENANTGHALGYGDDEYSLRVEKAFKDHFGSKSETYLVWNGTGANVMALAAALRPWEGVICADVGHIYTDETGAPEHIAGVKIFPVSTVDGKLTPEMIKEKVASLGWIHSNLPRMVSISQPTETGLVYSPDELSKIGETCRSAKLLLHVDGARLSNAAVSLGLSLRETIGPADILSFGGTKNGLMCGEAVVFLNGNIVSGIGHLRKNVLQLASKMRYLSVQYEVYLRDSLWKENAEKANRLASLLAISSEERLQIKPVYPVQTNALFVTLPSSVIQKVTKKWFFYTLDEHKGLSRWMCSWDNEEKDVTQFISDLANSFSI